MSAAKRYETRCYLLSATAVFRHLHALILSNDSYLNQRPGSWRSSRRPRRIRNYYRIKFTCQVYGIENSIKGYMRYYTVNYYHDKILFKSFFSLNCKYCSIKTTVQRMLENITFLLTWTIDKLLFNKQFKTNYLIVLELAHQLLWLAAGKTRSWRPRAQQGHTPQLVPSSLSSASNSGGQLRAAREGHDHLRLESLDITRKVLDTLRVEVTLHTYFKYESKMYYAFMSMSRRSHRSHGSR